MTNNGRDHLWPFSFPSKEKFFKENPTKIDGEQEKKTKQLGSGDRSFYFISFLLATVLFWRSALTSVESRDCCLSNGCLLFSSLTPLLCLFSFLPFRNI